MDVVQERDALNVTKVRYVRSGNIGGLLARSDANGSSFYSYDGSGNVVGLTNASQQVVAEYAYDAWGNTLRATGAMAGANTYRYSTKEYQSASGLYDYGFRFYSPGLGRWINRDPIRESGGLNLYAMVGNNPSNAVDAYGLWPSWQDVGNAWDDFWRGGHQKNADDMLDHKNDGDGDSEDIAFGDNGRSAGTFPSTPEELDNELGLPGTRSGNPSDKVTWELPRNNDGERQRYRYEKHSMDPCETYNPRHHGPHFHWDIKRGGQWQHQQPPNYVPGGGTGFLPGEPRPVI